MSIREVGTRYLAYIYFLFSRLKGGDGDADGNGKGRSISLYVKGKGGGERKDKDGAQAWINHIVLESY